MKKDLSILLLSIVMLSFTIGPSSSSVAVIHSECHYPTNGPLSWQQMQCAQSATNQFLQNAPVFTNVDNLVNNPTWRSYFSECMCPGPDIVIGGGGD